MVYSEYKDLDSPAAARDMVGSVCSLDGDTITSITDEERLRSQVIFTLQFNASVAHDSDIKRACIGWINKIAEACGITTGSNCAFYDEKAAGTYEFFTVPAINSRMVTFHTVRAAARAARTLGLPHIVYELALSEIGYTAQEKDEYVALVQAAHISLGFNKYVLYIQADHYQFDPDKYKEDKEREITRMKAYVVQAIEQGVYNIDIDASKFETNDPARTDRENQELNARLTAEMVHFIRAYEKEHALPCVISIGGEVGEVGGENTQYPQVNAYLALVDEFSRELGSGDAKGLSKVSINVGSAHGGVLGPDGRPLDTVPINFQAHHDLYMLGCDPRNPGKHVVPVQHGASTLPKKYFALFPAMHVGEIHLATGFQNVVWSVVEREDQELFKKMKELTREMFGDKLTAYETEAVGFMKERKRVTKLVKRDLLLSDAMDAVEAALELEFSTIFHSLYTVFQPQGGMAVQADRAD